MDQGRGSRDKGKVLLLAAGGLALGVLIGLLLGWYAFPLRWYDTDPSDLRLRHQMDYATMVADSFALTGDVDRARSRLAELTDDDTTWEQVANFVARVAVARRAEGDTLTAARLDALVADAGLPDPTLADYSMPAQTSGEGPRIGLVLLGAVAFVFAAGALAWFLLRAGKGAAQPTPEPTPPEETAEPEPSALTKASTAPKMRVPEAPLSQPQDRAPEPSGVRWEMVPQVSLDDDEADDEGSLDVTELTADALVHVPSVEDEASTSAAPTATPAETEESGDEADEPIAPERESVADESEATEEPEPSATSEIPEGALGVFHAEYIRGADDFDCSFTIEDADGTFLGECGVGIRDVLDFEGDQLVNAFEVWLFDKADIRTVSSVVASEYAYEDQVMYTRLSAKGDLALADDALELTLETQTLALTATVTGYDYGDGGPGPKSHFERFQVELVVERSPAA
jgi:hypothetical protein